MRQFFSILAGVLVAFAIVYGGDAVFQGIGVGEVPANADSESLGQYVEGQPVGALLIVVADWTVAAFVGSFIAAWFDRRLIAGWTATALFFMVTLANSRW